MQVQKSQMFFKLEMTIDVVEKCFKKFTLSKKKNWINLLPTPLHPEGVCWGRFMAAFIFKTASRPFFLAKCIELENRLVSVVLEITKECHQLSQIQC